MNVCVGSSRNTSSPQNAEAGKRGAVGGTRSAGPHRGPPARRWASGACPSPGARRGGHLRVSRRGLCRVGRAEPRSLLHAGGRGIWTRAPREVVRGAGRERRAPRAGATSAAARSGREGSPGRLPAGAGPRAGRRRLERAAGSPRRPAAGKGSTEPRISVLQR